VSYECEWQASDGDVAYVGGCNLFSLGREIVIGLMAIRLFLQFVLSMTKREVVPVSAMECVGLIIMVLA
jgi:hypothetical protein